MLGDLGRQPSWLPSSRQHHTTQNTILRAARDRDGRHRRDLRIAARAETRTRRRHGRAGRPRSIRAQARRPRTAARLGQGGRPLASQLTSFGRESVPFLHRAPQDACGASALQPRKPAPASTPTKIVRLPASAYPVQEDAEFSRRAHRHGSHEVDRPPTRGRTHVLGLWKHTHGNQSYGSGQQVSDGDLPRS